MQAKGYRDAELLKAIPFTKPAPIPLRLKLRYMKAINITSVTLNGRAMLNINQLC